MAKKLFISLLLLLPFVVNAQSSFLRNDIPVIVNGDTLDLPWAGGLNMPQFSNIDLNRDGIMDIFVFDREDNQMLTFVNKGSASQPAYHFAPEYIDSFPTQQHWVLLADYDMDGHEDLWAGMATSNIKVYRNMRGVTGKLQFQLIKDPIMSLYPFNPNPLMLTLYAAKNDMNAIVDVDQDGDLDILVFEVLGTAIEYHKNVSVDSGWVADSLRFVLQSYCFGHFQESGSGCSPILNQAPCQAGMKTEFNKAHAGSTILGLDLNCNGLTDLVIGDIDCPTVYALYNTGSTSIAHFDSTDLLYPGYDTSIVVDDEPANFWLDVDNDGTKDLVVAPNSPGMDRDGVWWYKNVGSDTCPHFEFRSRAFLQREMIEEGTSATPVFFDYNADGLMDILVGYNTRYLNAMADHPGGLSLYLNTGNANAPAFTLVNDDFLNLRNTATYGLLQGLSPAIGDLDQDGDDDLLIGELFGNMLHFENTAGPGNTATFVLVDTMYQNIDAGNMAAPHLYDMDGDTDLDLLLGNMNGYIHYYENIAASGPAVFDSITNKLGFVKINDETGSQFSMGFSKPWVLDYDHDGDVELMVGGATGEVFLFGNLSVNPADTFTAEGTLYGLDLGAYSAPSGRPDIENNPQHTFIVGNERGGLMLVEDNFLVSLDEEEIVSENLTIYPNPSKGSFRIATENMLLPAEVAVYDLMGKQILKEVLRTSDQEFVLTNAGSGIYLIVIDNGSVRISRKLILVK